MGETSKTYIDYKLFVDNQPKMGGTISNLTEGQHLLFKNDELIKTDAYDFQAQLIKELSSNLDNLNANRKKKFWLFRFRSWDWKYFEICVFQDRRYEFGIAVDHSERPIYISLDLLVIHFL